MTATVSIVVPAHNEAGVIVRCLATLLADAAPGEFEVVVAANGCTDGTESLVEGVARTRPEVRLVSLAESSKVLALNAGDRAAGSLFPRVYLDADVQVRAGAVRAVADRLREGHCLAAAPALSVDLARVSLGVRMYYRVWSELPWVNGDMIGSGFYAVSEKGRARFGEFPDFVADDYYAFCQFREGERQALRDQEFVISPPRTLRSLIRVRTRIELAKQALMPTLVAEGIAPTPGSLGLAVLLRRPALWPSIVVYGFVMLASRVRGRRLLRQDSEAGSRWVRDQTARTS